MKSRLETSGSAWVEFDSSARYYSPARAAGERARRLVPAEFEELITEASHKNGYRREEAVARIASLDRVELLPALALRACDWVPQVRDRARQAIATRLLADLDATIPVLLPVAVAVGSRRAGRWLLDNLTDFLQVGSPGLLAACLTVPDLEARRLVYETIEANAEQLVRAALTDHDVRIRRQCAREALRRFPETASELMNGTGPVRALAVEALAEDTELVGAALSDRSSSVRVAAQYLLRRKGIDPAVRYRELLSADEPPPIGALAGLADTGSSSDVPLFTRWLTHPLPRGRAQAVRALRLSRHTPISLLLPLLEDSPSVTKQVVLALEEQAGALDMAYLWELLEPARPIHLQQAALRLLRARSVWAGILADLRLLVTREGDMYAAGRGSLISWANFGSGRTYARPTAVQRVQLEPLLAAAESDLPQVVELIRFHLKDS